MNDFNKEWQRIISKSLVDIRSLSEITGYVHISIQLEISVDNIFEFLFRIKRDKFYKNKELDTILLFVNEEIKNINEVLIAMDNLIALPNKNSSLIKLYTYDLIDNIFDDLIKLGEKFALYEVSSNLLTVKDWWFGYYGIKITKSIDEQR